MYIWMSLSVSKEGACIVLPLCLIKIARVISSNHSEFPVKGVYCSSIYVAQSVRYGMQSVRKGWEDTIQSVQLQFSVRWATRHTTPQSQSYAGPDRKASHLICRVLRILGKTWKTVGESFCRVWLLIKKSQRTVYRQRFLWQVHFIGYSAGIRQKKSRRHDVRWRWQSLCHVSSRQRLPPCLFLTRLPPADLFDILFVEYIRSHSTNIIFLPNVSWTSPQRQSTSRHACPL